MDTTHDLVRVLCCGALQSDGISSAPVPNQPPPLSLAATISLTASYLILKFSYADIHITHACLHMLQPTANS